ncbi:hypothetical protein Tco_0951126 [Tanacetum coccineum]|uniref:Uncharacterized protein n=1 Tax=Tanacetum coccineum TaxID=301880 RepID=A0ABQ5DT79_9ASTR
MASLKYYDKHNQVGFLKKPKESAGFVEIVDFLKGSHIRYALTHNPTIHDSLVKQFWQTATASTLADGTLELRATIDTLDNNEDKELIVVPIAIKHSAAKVRPMKSSTNSKEEKFLTELQTLQTQEKEAFSTCNARNKP